MFSSLRCVDVVPTPITPPMPMRARHDGGWGAGGSSDSADEPGRHQLLRMYFNSQADSPESLEFLIRANHATKNKSRDC